MIQPSKIVLLEGLAERLAETRSRRRTTVLCHGVFDLLHLGHIRHLEAARALGDALVVTVTADEHVHKGPGRPAFTAQLRAEALAALSCVDYVAISRWPTAVEAITALRPDVYVKGGEYRDEGRDVTGGITAERRAVEAIGGRIAFTDEATFSSSQLLNRHFQILAEPARGFLAELRDRRGPDEVQQWLDRCRSLRVLVVGETIIDEYQYCHAIGKSSKAAAMVAQVESSEQFAGGIIAVANHVASVSDHVTVLTQLGARNRQEEFVRRQLNPAVHARLLTRHDAPTIVKRRFIESYFFTPMFELYEINDTSISEADDAAVCERLRDELAQHDVVIVVDYGHCMLTQNAVALLCKHSPYLAMNAQANAGNRGYHRISKYPRADYVCAAEHEMYLEARDWRGKIDPVVLDVAARLGCQRVVVTCGKDGALCYEPATGFTAVPALAGKVVDRVGAGDAFLAVTAPLAAAGAPLDVIGFVGNVAGAEAVATVGHRSYIDRARLTKYIHSLLA